MSELQETGRNLALIHQALTATHYEGVQLLDADGAEIARAGAVPVEPIDPAGTCRHSLRAYHQDLGEVVWVGPHSAHQDQARDATLQAAQALQRMASLEYELEHLSRELVDSYESIHMLCDVTDGWARTSSMQDLCRVLVDTLRRSIPCLGAVVLLPDGPDHMRPEAGAGMLEAAPLPERMELTPLLRRVLVRGHALILDGEGLAAADWSEDDLVRRAQYTLLALPMTSDDTALGVLLLLDRQWDGRNDPTAPFDTRDLKLARAVATQGAALIQRHRAAQTTRELDLGRRIQRSLLPQALPCTPTVTAAGLCVMARVVGGDFYDAVCPTPDLYNALIADVSGHDVGAALLMASARAQFHMDLQTSRSPRSTLKRLNRLLYDDLSHAEQFLTCFLACLDQEQGVLRYAGAGHNPGILMNPAHDHIEYLASTGLPLGVDPDAEFQELERPIREGDLLLLYTDGLTEAQDPQGRMFGEEALAATLQQHHQQPVGEILGHLNREVLSFSESDSLADDGTALLLRILPLSRVPAATIDRLEPQP